MSLPEQLCVSNVETIVDRLGLTEVAGPDGTDRMVLTSPMVPDKPVGRMRVWTGELPSGGSIQLVYVGLTVDMIKLDSHMMFAFTDPHSAVPHFTIDAVGNDDDFAFHLDQIPRLDLGAHLAYMDHCFIPLTEIREQGIAIEGLSKANIAPRQWALMSEWMIVHRASQPAFNEITGTVAAYREQWLGLAQAGIPAELLDGVTADELSLRDQRNRAAIFNPDVDVVWARVAQLVGDDQSEIVRTTLATQGALLEATP